MAQMSHGADVSPMISAGGPYLAGPCRNLCRSAAFRSRPQTAPLPKGQNMLGTIALVLLVLWLLGFFAFHITAAAIHLILVIAVILIVLHFLRGRRI
jgi:hypothetical protein